MCLFSVAKAPTQGLDLPRAVAAVEKGVELPPLEQEVRRNTWNVQRIILLAGLTWISIGIGAFVTLSALLAFPSKVTEDIPPRHAVDRSGAILHRLVPCDCVPVGREGELHQIKGSEAISY